MNQIEIQRYKLKSLIKRLGSTHNFVEQGLNSCNEPDDTQTRIVSINGIYHESHGYISEKVGEAGRVTSKPQPWIICLWEDSSELKRDMIVSIGVKDYRLIDIRNVDNLSIAADLSLEVILNG